MYRWDRIALVTALVVITASATYARDTYNAYAGPNVWGPTLTIRAHLGKSRYVIEYEAVGTSSVTGSVTYWNTADMKVTHRFNQTIIIETGNVVAAPQLQFKGTPTGTAVKVTVN